MNILKQWLNRQKEKDIADKKKDIAEGFRIIERLDTICIGHGRDVIQSFPETATVAEVIKELTLRRETAIKYSKI